MMRNNNSRGARNRPVTCRSVKRSSGRCGRTRASKGLGKPRRLSSTAAAASGELDIVHHLAVEEQGVARIVDGGQRPGVRRQAYAALIAQRAQSFMILPERQPRLPLTQGAVKLGQRQRV